MKGNFLSFNSTDFKDSLKKIIGQECWSAFISYGSTLILDFGRKTKNPLLREVPGRPMLLGGEFSFSIYCSWRIEDDSKVICSCQDSKGNTDFSKLDESVALLNGSIVLDIDILKPSLDFKMKFSNGMYLTVFCDREIDYDEEGELGTENYVFTIVNKDFNIYRNDLSSVFISDRIIIDDKEETDV
jgi:hypothetical protein